MPLWEMRVSSLKQRRRVPELGGMCRPGGSRPTGALARSSGQVRPFGHREEPRAFAFAEQAHTGFAVAVHKLRVAAPGAEGDQAGSDIDVTDR